MTKKRNLPEKKTEVIHGPQHNIKINDELSLKLGEKVDLCSDKNVPYSYTAIPPIAIKLQVTSIKVE